MLSDEARNTVQLEFEKEEYRRSLRPRSRAVFDVFNSSFVLWLLSAVVLSGLTGLWSYVAARHRATLEQQQRQTNLRSELAERWSKLYYATNNRYAEEAMTHNRSYFDVLLFGGALPISGLAQPARQRPFLFPEFSDSNLMALLTEAEQQTLDHSAKRAIKELRFKLRRLEKTFVSFPQPTDKISNDDLVKEVSTFQIEFRKVLGELRYTGDIAQPPGEYVPDFR